MTKHAFLELAEKRVLCFDGAMGTMLLEAGLPTGGVPELWNLDQPQVVQSIHQKYFDAGADVVHTNTFGGTALKLEVKGHAQKMKAINTKAVEIAKSVCPPGAFVAGDIGPTGTMLPPMGNASVEEWEQAFGDQASALIDAGADIISIETMFSLDEAKTALTRVKKISEIPVVAGITFNQTPAGYFTMMGETIEQCTKVLSENGADVIASNCTLGSGDYIELSRLICAAADKPVLIQPNAGKPVHNDDITTYAQSPAEFARDMQHVIEAGARMVGGCCGTNAEFIRQLAATIGK
jgi:methionine synthase I (cobalamin-dependent)